MWRKVTIERGKNIIKKTSKSFPPLKQSSSHVLTPFSMRNIFHDHEGDSLFIAEIYTGKVHQMIVPRIGQCPMVNNRGGAASLQAG
ncbi:hypothetical protein V6N13_146733 [Hibiscus sabdariffa]|uniref:Uncharacterized protein n=1 Tax=Hibiscus sabdariffa TaxID=183260 RepID=A0ABR2TTJ1_9ROSI